MFKEKTNRILVTETNVYHSQCLGKILGGQRHLVVKYRAVLLQVFSVYHLPLVATSVRQGGKQK